MYNSGKNGIIEMIFDDERIVNQYLKKFITQYYACATVGETNALNAYYGNYDEQAVLKKLIEIRKEYIKHQIVDNSRKDKQFTI